MSWVVEFKGDAEFTREAILRRVYARVGECLAPDGWLVTLDGEDPYRWRLTRERGVVRQEIVVGAYVPSGTWIALTRDGGPQTAGELPSTAQMGVSLKFSSEAIAEALRKLLPEDAAYIDAYRSSTKLLRSDVNASLQHLFPDERQVSQASVQDLAELDAWIDWLCRWYRERGAAALDACRDIPSLNRLAHTPWALSQTQTNLDLQEMLAILLVVHLTNDPGAPFMDWLGLVRRNQVEMYRWKCQRYADYPREFESVPVEVVENAIVDRLIERLRRRRAPNS